MKKWMVVLLVCGFAMFAGACSQTLPGKYKAEAPGAAHNGDAHAPAHGMNTPSKAVEESHVPPVEIGTPDAGQPAGDVMDTLAGIFCSAALNADPDKFFEMLHPAVLAYLEKGFELGEDKISIDQIKAAMKQQMQADPVLDCESVGAEIVTCDEYIVQMYKEVGLALDTCGRLKISVTLLQAGVQEAEFGTTRVDGAWYLNDM